MSVFDEKFSLLTIEAFLVADEKVSPPSLVGEMEVKFNPNTLQFGYQTEYVQRDAINKKSTANQFVIARPGTLSVDLLFGDTTKAGEEQVQQQIEDLKNLCASTNPNNGNPLLLKCSWGKMLWGGQKSFNGYMTGITVRYTRFDRQGLPLRAEVSLHLIADTNLEFEKQDIKLPQGNVINVEDMSTLATVAAMAAMSTATAGLTVNSLALANDLDTLSPPTAGDNLLVGANNESFAQS